MFDLLRITNFIKADQQDVALKAKRHSGRTAASDIETEGIMTTKPRIAIVIGSTRPSRYADKAAG
jgi:hypothetical protein